MGESPVTRAIRYGIIGRALLSGWVAAGVYGTVGFTVLTTGVRASQVKEERA